MFKPGKTFATIILCFCWLVLSTSSMRNRKPHIIFILGDDVGYNDVGWNNDKVPTENMNELARTGVILDYFYAHPLCTPSRAALLSGYYADRSGLQRGVLMETQPYGLPLEFSLLSNRLTDAGYHSVIVGKWHLGFCNWRYTPTRRGFSSFFGFYNGGQENYRHCYHYYSRNLTDGSCRGFDYRQQKSLAYQYTGQYSGGLFSQQIVETINNHKNGDPPIFAYVALSDSHWPLQAPERFRDKCRKSVNEARRNMCATMVSVDEEVGNITKALKNRGLYENSVIIFTSDNGGSALFGGNNYPLRGEKGGLYEGGCRTPAFVHSPLLERSGYVNKQLFHMVDWYPTLLRLAGAQPDRELDGFDQWDVISKNRQSRRRSLPYNLDSSDNGTLMAAVRDVRYKLIAGSGGNDNDIITEEATVDNSFNFPFIMQYINPREPSFNLSDRTPKLYDLINDPTESRDIAAEKPEEVQRMMRLLENYRSRSRPAVNTITDPRGHPENFNNTYSPGWCLPYYSTPIYTTRDTNIQTIQFY